MAVHTVEVVYCSAVGASCSEAVVYAADASYSATAEGSAAPFQISAESVAAFLAQRLRTPRPLLLTLWSLALQPAQRLSAKREAALEPSCSCSAWSKRLTHTHEQSTSLVLFKLVTHFTTNTR